MPWNYNDAEINGIIDSNIKDSPPNAPMINTASIIRSCLKIMWQAMRGQVSNAVTACDAATSSLISRSLSLQATICINGTDGNDARTGLTTDNNPVWGAVKTFTRITDLHNYKTQSLEIIVGGNTDVTTLVNLRIPFVLLRILPGATLTFRKVLAQKDSNNIVVGDGTARIMFEGYDLNIFNEGTIKVEAHAGSTGLGNQYYYRMMQGAISLSGYFLIDSNRLSIVNVTGGGILNIGDNTMFACCGASGTNSDNINRLARYRRSGVLGGSVVLGANAVESYFFGDQTVIKNYTPANSTDAKVGELELVRDSTYLYGKQGGIIKKIAWATF